MNQLKTRLESELLAIPDRNLVLAIRDFLVDPYRVTREWDYSDDTFYPCWIVAVDSETKTAIAYCEYGFGPSMPWGLLAIDSESNEMGPDSCWFQVLEDAFRQSPMWKGENPDGYEIR